MGGNENFKALDQIVVRHKDMISAPKWQVYCSPHRPVETDQNVSNMVTEPISTLEKSEPVDSTTTNVNHGAGYGLLLMMTFLVLLIMKYFHEGYQHNVQLSINSYPLFVNEEF